MTMVQKNTRKKIKKANAETVLKPRSKETKAKKNATIDIKENNEDTASKSKRKTAPEISTVKTKSKKQKVCFEVPSLKTISGKVFVIGQNDVGQLGLGEDVDLKKRPAPLDLPQSVVDVAAGGMHSICLTESGEVITFGCNDEGALGRTTADESSIHIPLKVELPEKIIRVTAGDSHSAALSESGQVYLWGNFRNGNGPMGLTADGLGQPKPIKILNGVTVVGISSGNDHLVCLSNEGLVYTCGSAEIGQLGRISERSRDGGRKGLAALLKPDVVPLRSRGKAVTIDQVWTGSYSTFLRAQENGLVWAFGLNNYNQLGFISENSNSSENDKKCEFTPKQVPSFDNNKWNEISCGQHHTITLDETGKVFSIGRKDDGRLGLGEDCEDVSVPTLIPRLEKLKCSEVSCGESVSFAVTEQGSLYSWGFGENYQLGHGDDEDCHEPRQVEGNFSKLWKVLKVSGGGQHTLILAVPRESTEKNGKL